MFVILSFVTKRQDEGADIASNSGTGWLKTDLYHAELHLHRQRKRQINTSQSIHLSVKLLWLWSFWAFVCLIWKSCALCTLAGRTGLRPERRIYWALSGMLEPDTDSSHQITSSAEDILFLNHRISSLHWDTNINIRYLYSTLLLPGPRNKNKWEFSFEKLFAHNLPTD